MLNTNRFRRTTAIAGSWLPARTRRALSRAITRRNAVDRAIAVEYGVDPDGAGRARYSAEGRRMLDRVISKAAASGITPRPWAIAKAYAEEARHGQ